MAAHLEGLNVARLLRQQAALARFGSYAFAEPSLFLVLSEAARVCAEGLNVPFCKVCRYRKEDDDLLVEAGCGWQEGVVGRVVSPADETSPQGRAFVTGMPVIIGDLNTANNVRLPDFYRQHGIVSTIDVIIKGRSGEPYGVLEVDSPVQHTYDEHDVQFLTGFANVLAEAVATAQRNEVLRATIKAMEALAVEKDKLINERAVLAEELKHRVRNNLLLIQSMLFAHLKLDSVDQDHASVRAISRRVATLAEVYEQLLGTGLGRTIDLGEYLRSLCARLPGLQKAADSGIRLRCDADLLLVDLDTATAIGMVVAGLVSNGYDHAFRGAAPGSITVALRYPGGTHEAVLTIADDGKGFVAQTGSKRHGVGLVRRLAHQIRGTLQQEPGPGTTWTLRFPVGAAPPELTSPDATAAPHGA
jgi:two-component sensor histidine kinase